MQKESLQLFITSIYVLPTVKFKVYVQLITWGRVLLKNLIATDTRLTHKIAIQLHLVSENCTICSSRSRRPVRKILDTLS